MTCRTWRVTVLVAATCVPAAAVAQLGELHVGSMVTYGTAGSYGPGAGLILGAAAGRLVYVGARWTYHTGSTEPAQGAGITGEIRNRLQVVGADVGLLFPVGPFELVPGATVGVVRFSQRASISVPNGSVDQHAFEFFGAPGVALHVRVGRIRLIPEVQYGSAGAPPLAWPIARRGLMTSLRVVLALEVDRIRY